MNNIYIRIKDDADFKRLAEDYGYLGWKLVRHGNYAVPTIEKKKPKNEKKRSSSENGRDSRGSGSRTSSSDNRIRKEPSPRT